MLKGFYNSLAVKARFHNELLVKGNYEDYVHEKLF